jgi:hypothetical protein
MAVVVVAPRLVALSCFMPGDDGGNSKKARPVIVANEIGCRIINWQGFADGKNFFPHPMMCKKQ